MKTSLNVHEENFEAVDHHCEKFQPRAKLERKVFFFFLIFLFFLFFPQGHLLKMSPPRIKLALKAATLGPLSSIASGFSPYVIGATL